MAPSLVGTAGTTASGSTATIICNKPTGAVEGNHLIAVQAYRGGSFSGGIPSGWEQLALASSSQITRLLHKKLGASEGSNYSFGGGADGNKQAVAILAVQDCDDTITNASGTGFFSTTITAPGLTAATGEALIVRFGTGTPATSFSPPASHTERADVGTGSGTFDIGVTAATADSLAAAGSVATANFTAATSADGWVAYTVAFYPPLSQSRIVVVSGAVGRSYNY